MGSNTAPDWKRRLCRTAPIRPPSCAAVPLVRGDFGGLSRQSMPRRELFAVEMEQQKTARSFGSFAQGLRAQ